MPNRRPGSFYGPKNALSALTKGPAGFGGAQVLPKAQEDNDKSSSQDQKPMKLL